MLYVTNDKFSSVHVNEEIIRFYVLYPLTIYHIIDSQLSYPVTYTAFICLHSGLKAATLLFLPVFSFPCLLHRQFPSTVSPSTPSLFRSLSFALSLSLCRLFAVSLIFHALQILLIYVNLNKCAPSIFCHQLIAASSSSPSSFSISYLSPKPLDPYGPQAHTLSKACFRHAFCS